MRQRLPSAFYNMTSLAGAGIAVITLTLIAMLFVLEVFSSANHPYMGLVTFIALPPFLIVGVFLIVFGILRARKRARAGTPIAPLPSIDFNNPQHRRAATLFTFGGVLFLGLSAFGSYQAYEYTDSIQFCGLVCHKVMKPEYVSYQGSPHARVACVECHIGSGASAFVQSKISGSYQVYSVLFNKFSRPIPTPVHNLRPAKETCEQCHWPRNFYSAKLQSKSYYLSDASNTNSHLNLLMKIGGSNPTEGAAGIHAHMYLNNQVSYVALDRQRSKIPYVVTTGPDGSKTEYFSTENPATPEELAKGEHRTVDCIDCHNRPTHIYRNPSQSVNQALEQGNVSATLPEIKRIGVEALDAEYASDSKADEGITRTITDLYRTTYPKIAETRQADIQKAIASIREIYHRNYFPTMKVSWKKFPNNVGHMYADGCFRCHDGKHVSKNGKVITKDCNTCHTLLSQKMASGPERTSLKGIPFQHPGEVGDSWKDMNCSGCHGVQEQ